MYTLTSLIFLALDPKQKCGTSDSSAQNPERIKHPGELLLCPGLLALCSCDFYSFFGGLLLKGICISPWLERQLKHLLWCCQPSLLNVISKMLQCPWFLSPESCRQSNENIHRAIDKVIYRRLFFFFFFMMLLHFRIFLHKAWTGTVRDNGFDFPLHSYTVWFYGDGVALCCSRECCPFFTIFISCCCLYNSY